MNDLDYDQHEILALADSIDRLSFSLNDLRRSLAHNPISSLEGYVDFSVRLAALGPRETWHAAGAFLERLLVLRDLSEGEIALLADLVDTCF
jgi:hypothetical protein